MDKRDKFMFMLRDWFKKYKSVPEEYQDSFKIFRREGFKSWRVQPQVRKRIQKAAKKAARAKGLERLTQEQQRSAFKVLHDKGAESFIDFIRGLIR
jgi:hypothetical protein